jgi:hypothetical protein
MVHPSIIEARLGELRFRSSRWFRAEVHELQHVLMDHEKIVALACGRYFGSFALLVATDQRLLLIDKRVFFMNIEDTRYDMISEILYSSQMYSATVTIHTINKVHKFTSIKNKSQLRELTNYVQKRVMELRNQPSHVPMPDAPSRHLPEPVQRDAASSQPSAMIPAYNYSPATSDDAVLPTAQDQSPELAQMVGSAAMQATHRRPFHPYISGSLMTHSTMGDTPYTEY